MRSRRGGREGRWPATVFAMVPVCGLLLCGPVLAVETELSPFKSTGEKFSLKEGEQLTYSIHWMGMTVGQAIMRVREIADEKGKPAYHLTTQVRSNRVIRWIYKVEDDAISFVEVDGFRPLRFDKHLHEGKRKKEEIIDFDWEKKEAVYYKIRSEQQKKRRAIPLEDGAQDSLSCLYFLRSFPMKPEEKYIMKVATEKKCWDLKIKPLREEKLDRGDYGMFDAVVIEPIAEFDGLFVRSDKKLTIWLDKETKIVLKMVASIPVGTVTVKLEGVADTKTNPDRAVDLPRSGPKIERREIKREKATGTIPWKEKPEKDEADAEGSGDTPEKPGEGEEH